MGIQRDDSRGRRRFGAEMEARRASETEEEFKSVRRGWCLGGKEFREELLEQIEEERQVWHYGEEIAESDEQRAQRIIQAALKKKRWEVAELKRLGKGDA